MVHERKRTTAGASLNSRLKKIIVAKDKKIKILLATNKAQANKIKKASKSKSAEEISENVLKQGDT